MPKPDYGIDSPPVLNKTIAATIAFCAGGWFIPSFKIQGFTIAFIGPILLITGLLFLVVWLSLVLYVFVGKFNMRQRIIDMVDWKGDEQVLDIGTGRGLLMIAAAKKLTTGRSFGIDTWQDDHLSGNIIQNADINVDLEGVKAKVKIITSDARKITFPNDSFDITLSLLCLHNIRRSRERAAACIEIARVLKPNGTAIIADYTYMEEYEKNLTKAGLKVEKSIPCHSTALRPMYIIKATKV